MKLLLTSGGLSTPTLQATFKKLNPKPLKEVKVSFIITASLVETGDKQWLVKDVNQLYQLGVGEIDIVDIACLTLDEILTRLQWADCIFVEGGNTAYLMSVFIKTGLVKKLAELLKTKLYVGVSAGSMIMGYRLPLQISKEIYPEDTYQEYGVNELLGWHNFCIVPHYGAGHIPQLDRSFLDKIKISTPIYVLDDQSALLINGKEVEVVSDGTWELVRNA